MDRRNPRRHTRSKTLIALGLIVFSFTVASRAGPAHARGAVLSDIPARGVHAVSQLALPASGAALDVLLWGGVALLAGAGFGRLVAGRSHGCVIALALVLSTSVFTLETAVHSVHHLGDPESAATCPALSVSQNVSWAGAEAPDAGTPPPRVSAAPLVRGEDSPPSQMYRPHSGRAPPA